MKYADELHEALIEITSNPDLGRDAWEEAINAKVRELIEKYREEHSRELNSEGVPQNPTSSYYPKD
ncbi:MAG: hypothetical protein HQ553_09500 [Chloroflexi bacterium]|nr:hypothetical protein [Chloroflexota bacterium]